MRRPLLCELHAHTTWSDGELTVRELADLYGGAGFDVLAITDHVVRGQDRATVTAANHAAYLAEVEAEAERAAARYGLLVIPGLELTDDDPDPRRAAHALAIGVREFVGLETGLDAALVRARGRGAALIGAHPFTLTALAQATRSTARYAEDRAWAAKAVDRLEVCNRHDFFDWVARARLPVVATGDFHRREHLATWKTVLPAEKREEAVVDYLRSRRPVWLASVEAARERAA
ncbi:MAG TPA: hypothetical protein VEG40_11635 [Gaiellaceae bacterium]|nr:hypothetical protein [Gaiellaceae bacterium]